MTNIKNTIMLTKLLNTMFTNDKFLSDLCNLCNNSYNGVLFALGDILEYYITSRDTKPHTVEEMNVVIGLFKYVGTTKSYRLYNIRNNEDVNKCLYRNVIKEGYLTRSTNPYFLKRIKKYNLGDTRNIDEDFNKKLEFLESIFGKNNYSFPETLENNQFCMTTPGTNTFYYAGSNCPKRFFLGILGQEKDNILPITLGETKINYFKRVFDNKLLNITLNKKIKKKVLKIGYKLINDLCKNDPIALLIPVYSDNYSITIVKQKNIDYDASPIGDIIYLNLINSSPLNFFSRDFGETNPLGNLISYRTIIPYKELGIINIPDRFKIISIIAKNKGYKKGTNINYNNGEQI